MQRSAIFCTRPSDKDFIWTHDLFAHSTSTSSCFIAKVIYPFRLNNFRMLMNGAPRAIKIFITQAHYRCRHGCNSEVKHHLNIKTTSFVPLFRFVRTQTNPKSTRHKMSLTQTAQILIFALGILFAVSIAEAHHEYRRKVSPEASNMAELVSKLCDL